MNVNRKRVLLIHPLGYQAQAAGNDIARFANIMPPIGLAGLAAWLDNLGFETALVDCYARPGSDGRIRELLTAWQPAFLGLSCTTSSFHDGARIAALAKTIQPGIMTIIGGPHVSALKAKALAGFPALDFAVVGEGEETLAEIVSGGWENPGAVKGLVYRDAAGTPLFNGYRDTAIDLDNLPFPAYGKLAGYPQAYRLPIFNYPRAPNTSCVSSRGCPYACTYCDRSVFGRSFRFNSAEYMIEHVRFLNRRFGVRHINFYDDNFTFNRKRIEAFTRRLMSGGLGLTYNCAARAEHLDEDLLRQLKASGCWMISLGIETGDPDLLAQHRQRADLDLMREKILLIKRVGIRVKGLLMMGLPGESEASVRRSMDYVYALPIDDFNLAKFTPFPGSPLYENIRELGTFDEDWENMDCMHLQFIPKGMTREQLDRLFQEFYRRHFMRPRVMWDYTTMIWRSPDSWRRFWSSAGRFMRFARSNNRMGA
jgi:anaerobic magnesium-protoporphyrin IX monomethyl ester cyclase